MNNELIKPTNFSFSSYQRTYNNAIDLVAECVGYHRGIHAPIKAIHLRPDRYGLFQKGVEVLMRQQGKEYNPDQRMEFDGVYIENGGRYQIESIRVEFYPLKAEA